MEDWFEYKHCIVWSQAHFHPNQISGPGLSKNGLMVKLRLCEISVSFSANVMVNYADKSYSTTASDFQCRCQGEFSFTSASGSIVSEKVIVINVSIPG